MNYQTLFYPKSIALIGASRKEKTVGNDVAHNLIKSFKGEIYLINPKAEEIYGHQVLSDISQITGQVDLAVLAIPAKFVPESIAKIAQKGAKAAIVISAGFKEAGNQDLEDELAKISQENDMILIGPNCLGAINPEIEMNASFAAIMPQPGEIAFISQSGALCTAVLDYAQNLGIGFSKFISIGNKATTDELDLINYLKNDDKTKVIIIYAEALKDANAFVQLSQEMARSANPKPIIILKSGKSEEGSKAIASHTGSLSGGDNAYQALFKQAGIIRANGIRELFEYAQIFSQNKIMPAQKVAIITNAGGPGVLTTDEIAEHQLNLAQLSPSTMAELKTFLPEAANTHNPVDVLGDAGAERYQKSLQVLVKDPQVDAVIIILTPQSMTEIQATAQAIIDIKKTTDKPIVVSFMGDQTVKPGVDLLKNNKITTYPYPEPAANNLSRLNSYYQMIHTPISPVTKFNDVDRQTVTNLFNQAKTNGQTSFPEAEAIKILEAYNFSTLKSQIVTSQEEAEKVATQIGKPIAMKIVSPDILHKSDVGGVRLNVTSANAGSEYQNMLQTVKGHLPNAKLEGALMVEMAPSVGTEIILGVNKQPGLGTLLMVGLGGIYVEIFKDVSFGFAPLTQETVDRMISELKSSAIFQGARGQSKLDVESLKQTIARLSQLVVDFPQISELDINPLLLLPEGQGVKVLDARIVIE